MNFYKQNTCQWSIKFRLFKITCMKLCLNIFLIIQSSIDSRMSSQNQKSFLSQVTLDTSKINKQSLSTSILPPLHTGESSYVVYKHKVSSRHHNRPLPFGSTSSRVTDQLQPKISSHIVSYESIDSKFKQYSENFASPFGSSDVRFKDPGNRSPGPGLYKSQEINSIKNSNTSWKFSKVNRDLINQKNIQNTVGPGAYDVEESSKSLKFRQRIAEKYREQRKKYIQILAHHSNKEHQTNKFVGLSEKNEINHHSSNEQSKEKSKVKVQKVNSPINRFILKDSTKKFVMKQQKENKRHECDHTSLINKNFTYNFIEKTDNAFSSYIPKVYDTPGPGYYPVKKQAEPINQSFNFKSSSVRVLFPTSNVQVKKQKPKLSELL